MLRAAIGTGLMVGVAGGTVAAVIGLVPLLAGELSVRDWAGMSGKLGVVTTLLGFGFSGVLALIAGGRSFATLSLRFVASVGAGAGLVYWLVIGSTNAFRVWTLSAALFNLTLLVVMGASAASGALILAHRSRRALTQEGEALGSLGEGSLEDALAGRERELAAAERRR
ncbi:MAG: hypothetical protein V4503_09650 [Gemmatimonadota bacterium]